MNSNPLVQMWTVSPREGRDLPKATHHFGAEPVPTRFSNYQVSVFPFPESARVSGKETKWVMA